MMWMFAFAVLTLCLVLGVMYLSRGDADTRLTRAERDELARHRDLVARLRDLAIDHRELDSALATILLDEIRTFERELRRRDQLE